MEYPVAENLVRFLEARRSQPPIDDAFVAAVEEAGEQANQPVEASPWGWQLIGNATFRLPPPLSPGGMALPRAIAASLSAFLD